MTQVATSPLTFDLHLDLLIKLQELQRQSGVRSISEIIREALAVFNPGKLSEKSKKHRQISVRLPNELRRHLGQLSRKHKLSAGEILREALLEISKADSSFNPKTKTMPKKKVTKKKAAVKAVRKAPAKKKAVKKAVKKAPAKKAAKKAVKKKAPAKKKAVKKAVKKKAPAKKKAVKKAVKKKAPAKKAAKKAVKKAVKKKAPAKKKAVKKAAKKKAPAKKATKARKK